MDEKKIKVAFSKVKGDFTKVAEDVASLQMQVARVTRDGTDSSGSDLSKDILKLNKLIESLDKKVDSLDSKLSESKQDNQFSREGVTILNDKLADFQGLVNDKLALEIAELRMEFTEEIAKVFDNMTKGLEKVEKKAEKKSETKKVEKVVVAEKVEKKSKKEEILEKDAELLDENQKTLVEIDEVLGEEKPKKGKFKKFISWLFVDEDEDEDLFELKQEVEASTKKDSKSSEKKR